MTRVAGRAKVEISGGVTLDRIPELATTGADFVSIGALDAFGASRRPQLRARAGVRFDVRWHQSVPSTMDVAAKLAAEGAAHGVVVAAEEQTAGRGRRGSSWASPPGAGLYFSFIARPIACQTLSLIDARRRRRRA